MIVKSDLKRRGQFWLIVVPSSARHKDGLGLAGSWGRGAAYVVQEHPFGRRGLSQDLGESSRFALAALWSVLLKNCPTRSPEKE